MNEVLVEGDGPKHMQHHVTGCGVHTVSTCPEPAGRERETRPSFRHGGNSLGNEQSGSRREEGRRLVKEDDISKGQSTVAATAGMALG